MHIALRHPTIADVDLIAWNMRECDRREIWASHRSLPHDALTEGWRLSTLVRVGTVDDRAVCMFGVTARSALSTTGTPWMLATQELERVQRPFLRLSLPVVELMQDEYPKLENYVDARNDRTIRWLKWLGFKLAPSAPFGVSRLPFHRFTRSRRHV